MLPLSSTRHACGRGGRRRGVETGVRCRPEPSGRSTDRGCQSGVRRCRRRRIQPQRRHVRAPLAPGAPARPSGALISTHRGRLWRHDTRRRERDFDWDQVVSAVAGGQGQIAVGVFNACRTKFIDVDTQPISPALLGPIQRRVGLFHQGFRGVLPTSKWPAPCSTSRRSERRFRRRRNWSVRRCHGSAGHAFADLHIPL